MEKKTNMMSLVLAVVLLMLFTASCTKKMTQTDEAMVTTPPEVSKAMDSSPAEDGRAARSQEEGLPAEADADAAVVEEKVHFAFNSFLLSDQARMILNEKADYLRSNPGIRITVEGHCDERGEDAYNMALGQRRAESVKTFLVHLGIDALRMNTASFGENKPIAMGQDEAAWAQNRRAEFLVK